MPFFRRFIELVTAYAGPEQRVYFSIQTNGSLLDEEWASFFFENRFLVGLSLDGSREMHDLYRVDANGDGSWGRTVRSFRLLQRKSVDVNLLCVVTGQFARRPQQMYGALKKLGARYLQFIPCLDPLDAERGTLPFSLSAQEYGEFLCRLFDLWYRDWKSGSYVSVRQFDDYVHLLTGQAPSACSAAGHCGDYLVVESTGSLYPCDFYATDAWLLGDIREAGGLSKVFESEKACRFHEEGEQRPAACRSCEWFFICRGGCKRDWCTAYDGEKKNYYCEAFRRFFPHSIERLREIALAEISYAHNVAYGNCP